LRGQPRGKSTTLALRGSGFALMNETQAWRASLCLGYFCEKVVVRAMQMIWNIVLVVAGLAVMSKSADVFVQASTSLAKHLRLPSILVGLVIVAYGTSAPEMAISVSAAIGGNGDLVVANSVGASMFNLLGIVGLCALLWPAVVDLKPLKRDYWFSVASAVTLMVLVLVFGPQLPRAAGAVLLLGFVIYMFVVVRSEMKKRGSDPALLQHDNDASMSLAKSIIFSILCIALIAAGGHATVFGATRLALELGVSQRIIGLTVVAIGTSLPELVTAIAACRKGESGLVLGLVIGSNIFNELMVLGLAGTIAPLVVERGVVFDLALLITGLLLFYPVACRKRKKPVVRVAGGVMLLGYIAYMVWAIIT